jgi:hypothetical protein
VQQATLAVEMGFCLPMPSQGGALPTLRLMRYQVEPHQPSHEMTLPSAGKCMEGNILDTWIRQPGGTSNPREGKDASPCREKTK